jgi:hypothetical protein
MVDIIKGDTATALFNQKFHYLSSGLRLSLETDGA